MSGGHGRVWVWAAIVALATALPAGAQTFPAGRLTGSVVSRSNPAHHYAVYVPTSFDANRPTPVLFVMDYRGRARVGAEVFRPAAERFGWIIMSSNHTASDESPEPSLVALRAMWTDAYDLFPIDPKRFYLAGLSGTARTATWVATRLPGTFAGIIGAAAGFAPDVTPSRDQPFLYFGTAGDADYNYWEMRELERRLASLGASHRMEYFSGSHGWMPPSLAMAAVEWMQLRAMQNKSAPVDPSLLDALWWRDLLTSEMLEEAGRLPAAGRRLGAMLRDYEGLRLAADLDVLRARRAKLDAEPRLAAAADAERLAAAAHASRIEASMRIIARAFPVRTGAPVAPVAKTLEDLGVPALLAAAAGTDQTSAMEAHRLLAELDVQCGFYLPTDALRAGEDARASYYLDLAKVIAPDEPFAWFLRAKVAARAGRVQDTVEALARAVQRGFRTLDALEHDPAFTGLRAEPEFKRLVEQVRVAWDRGGIR